MADVELLGATRVFAEMTVSVSLRVLSGRRLGLVGPSGCGKTTALRLIAGLERPDSGDIVIDGESMSGVRPELRDTVMVFQDPALFPFHTVAGNVGYGLQIRKVGETERARRVNEALDAVQLGGFAERWPGDLSGGERQRVALARALVVEPRVLLLDEPFASLDPPLRRDLQALVCELQRQRAITTVFVTHDLHEAMIVSDEMAVMIDGSVRQVGPPHEVMAIMANPADDAVQAFVAPRPASGQVR